jgi:hypothetical protein
MKSGKNTGFEMAGRIQSIRRKQFSKLGKSAQREIEKLHCQSFGNRPGPASLWQALPFN